MTTSFSQGLLIPLLKKTTLDPTIAKNYRPITISNTMSKILELYILDVSGHHDFCDLQFGFVAGRGTDMATSMAHDVFSYCTRRGSPVYTCSLDAEGAFDAVPHDILFQKAINAVPDHFWRIMVNWYSSITVRIKWNSQLSDTIMVCKGTRQGVLSSPFLFNLFYQDLITELSEGIDGIKINNLSYNVFCYADDILLASLTVTGLQNMVDVANRYITDHGLRFNPLKTECVSFGQNYFDPTPVWNLNDVKLKNSDKVNYLGVTLANKPNVHIHERISACRRAYYAMQGAGFSNVTANVNMLSYIWEAAIRSVLTYGTSSVSISKKSLADMERLQTKLLKAGLGLHKFCRSSPIMSALNIKKIESTIEIRSLDLIRSILCNSSRARPFYSHVLNQHICGKLNGHTDLIARVKVTCKKYDISFMKYIFDTSYSQSVRNDLKKMYTVEDGVTDSVRQLLLRHDPYSRVLLNLLLRAF